MSGIITLSEMVTLALHSMVILAQQNEELVSAKHLAELTNSSEFHLSKVLQLLVKKGFLKSVRGPKGGFKLIKSPNDITFYDIYTALEGPISVKKCPANCEDCKFRSCIFDRFLDDLNSELINYMKSRTFSSFVLTNKIT